MGTVDEIISKYTAGKSKIDEFGPWLLQDEDSAAKDEALSALWARLEGVPVVEDVSLRKAKFDELMERLGEQPQGLSHRPARRYVWVFPVLVAAAIAIALIIWKQGTSPVTAPYVADNTSTTASAPVDSKLKIFAETLPEGPALLAETNVTLESSASMQKPSILHTEKQELPTEPVATFAADTTEVTALTSDETQDPWKALENEDRLAAEKAARRRRPSLALFGAGVVTFPTISMTHKDFFAVDPVVHDDTSQFIAADNIGRDKIKHDLPLNFGLSLRLPVSGKLSLESGITYSVLHSSARTLSYIGLPLYLQCDLIRGQRANVYFSGGGSISYCIAGGGKEHIWQPAATVSAGAEYRLFGGVDIFGEVSFNHYFDDGSPLETYYSRNPDTPAFKAGLRFVLPK